MKTKRIVLGLFTLSIFGFGAGLALKSSTELGMCLVSEPVCINHLTQIGNALFYGMGALAIVFFLLLFSLQAYGAWKKFAIWYVPLVALYFAIYKDGGFFSIPEESVYRFLSIIYVIVSLVIIAVTAMRTKKQ